MQAQRRPGRRRNGGEEILQMHVGIPGKKTEDGELEEFSQVKAAVLAGPGDDLADLLHGSFILVLGEAFGMSWQASSIASLTPSGRSTRRVIYASSPELNRIRLCGTMRMPKSSARCMVRSSFSGSEGYCSVGGFSTYFPQRPTMVKRLLLRVSLYVSMSTESLGCTPVTVTLRCTI